MNIWNEKPQAKNLSISSGGSNISHNPLLSVPFDIRQDIYFYAVSRDDHMLAWNIMVVVSQFPYERLGHSASVLALAATRNSYMDIVELAIRCFENWEDKSACIFLKQSFFEERWLRDYADEVYEYIMEENNRNVLPKKDYSWEMAKRQHFAVGNVGGYRSRYGSC